MSSVDVYDVWADRTKSIIERWSTQNAKENFSPEDRIKNCLSEIDDEYTKGMIEGKITVFSTMGQ